ncbi:chromate efflux transporter [Aciduricibacillus chroicocephali]|uniref:Chromate efflux transporter n=1 Tax=Aciduricibacillus chroicocephali TaxID=3054939 RepID=A0ABY9KWH8_9BACI|nr:chromate efflux transporter [Bacillaceae bacterium 44XB]
MEVRRKSRIKTLIEILIVSLKLGCTSFGGPIAHLGYFHQEYVRRRKWMDEESYADLVALSQFLPGPASSQVGIGVGVIHGGVIGGIISFVGFTLPSVLVLIVFAMYLHTFNVNEAGWIHGLKIVAVVVVAHAILGMAKKLTPDMPRQTIALAALIAVLVIPAATIQIIVIILAAVVGFLIYRNQIAADKLQSIKQFPVSRRFGLLCLVAFFLLLFLLPILSRVISSDWFAIISDFYRSGALVFGGGHVVLPLLEQAFVQAGRLNESQFLAGYGVTQAVPGPLFTFAAYIGTIMKGSLGGVIAIVAIFLPAFLLILGVLPFWNTIRGNAKVKGALMGVNAAVVGILLAALYNPIWTTSILDVYDFVLAAILFGMLVFWKMPPWTVVIAGILGGWLML